MTIEGSVNKAEVRGMLETEYNEAEVMELFREEGREEGRAEGREDAFLSVAANLMNSMSLSPEEALEKMGIPLEQKTHLLKKLLSNN